MKALAHLMGAYFHQDWDMDGGTLSDTTDAFAAGEPTLVAAAIADIETIISTPMPPGSLEDQLGEMGCAYYAGDTDEDYRAWLGELRVLLMRHVPAS